MQDNATKLACAIFPAYRRGEEAPPPWLRFLNILTRASALFGGLPMMLGMGLTFLMVAAQATAITVGFYFFSGLFILDALIVLVTGVLFWPVAASGMVDHSMLDYYTAALHSYASDWQQPLTRPLGPGAPPKAASAAVPRPDIAPAGGAQQGRA
jgi:hypothetical protein